MKYLFLVIILFLTLVPEFELTQAQSLKNNSIFQSFNLSNYGLRSALRSAPFAVSL